MSDYKVTIGIEIHAEINTKTKMFTNSKNSFFDKVNTNINEYDVALPGSLPIVNMNVVDNAISLAYALNMQIDHILKFDRKPYRHYDLPKGFQITQFFHPIATNGFVETKTKKIGIEEFHIEEDTAKAIIENDIVKLDYNRSGVPLIEIVSKPEIYSAFEAVEYLKEIKAILTFLNICDGKLENGSMRADVNISIDKEEYCKGQRVEIKNLNSFNNVEKAIEFEISRQKELLENNQEVLFETRM
jgi:aspartyl-tRNA(Asn)/glutamyl-tRNA(Gln) amidotransferase subunit B